MPQNTVVPLNETKSGTPFNQGPANQGPARFPVLDQQDDEIDLMALMRTLWRGKWVILLAVFLAVFAGGYYAYRVAVPVYTTTTTVVVDPQQQNIPGLTSVTPVILKDPTTLNTAIQMILSRGLMQKLVEKLDLTRDPEFNTALRPKSPYAIKSLINGLLGIQSPKVVLTDQKVLAATVGNVLKVISASNKRKTYVLDIKATTTSPKKSALLTNTLADLYILNQLDLKFKATQQATKWITGRVAKLKQELESALEKTKNLNLLAELISPEGLIKFEQLRQAQVSYNNSLKQLKGILFQQGILKADSRVLSSAVIPIGASAPRRSLILALSAMLGLFAGAGVVLGREMLQNGFRTVEELELSTGYTVMGQIPKLPVNKRLDTIRYLIDKPTSAAAESVRNLRTSVLLSNVDNPPKVIMVTSSLPGEGKATASLALAESLAGLGKKVLLAEGDIRRCTFTQYFDVDVNLQGILSVIAGEAALEDVVYRNPKLGFDVLVGEKSSANTADVFSSEKFRSFLTDARNTYDYVVIGAPPVLVVTDARVIAQLVDAVLYCVKWDATPKSQVFRALRCLKPLTNQ